MKLYVMRPVMMPVPIVWTARSGIGLRPAKRKTPAKRIAIKEHRKRMEKYWNNPLVQEYIRKRLEELDLVNEMTIGETIVFKRFEELQNS